MSHHLRLEWRRLQSFRRTHVKREQLTNYENVFEKITIPRFRKNEYD